MGSDLRPYSIWRHAKGAFYTVLAVAGHTETGEEVVVYLDRFGKVWVRPIDLFLERFTPAEEADPHDARNEVPDGDPG